MRRRRPRGNVVPPELLEHPEWSRFEEWCDARAAWVAAGNEWPGGEVARWQEEFTYILDNWRDQPMEPFDWSVI